MDGRGRPTPEGSSQHVASAAFEPEIGSVAQACDFVGQWLAALSAGDAREDAVRLVRRWARSAVLDAGTPFEVICRLSDGLVEIAVRDHQTPTPSLEPYPPQRETPVRADVAMPSALARAWGVTCTEHDKTVWVRLADSTVRDTVTSPEREGGLDLPWPVPPSRLTSEEWARLAHAQHSWRGIDFLAEASDLLAGTLDQQMTIALVAQLVVPRLATWCAIYTTSEFGDVKLAYVWHADEDRIDAVRELLAAAPPQAGGGRYLPETPPLVYGNDHAYCFPLVARGRSLGLLVLGQPERRRLPRESADLVEDLSRRAALSLDNARLYSAQRSTSMALQRSLLPPEVPAIPGVDLAVVYEPAGEGAEVGGDFYDVYALEENRWRFAIGDVCGTGPQAAAVTGLARHGLRILGREGYPVDAVMERLNQLILDEGPRARFLTMIHGELAPRPDGGLRMEMVCAGHPLPLRLRGEEVTSVGGPQPLLGVLDGVRFSNEVVEFDPGDVVLFVTDGITERRRLDPLTGQDRMLEDDDGLERLLGSCAGLSAGTVAARIRRAVAEFGSQPSADDMALIVIRAEPPLPEEESEEAVDAGGDGPHWDGSG